MEDRLIALTPWVLALVLEALGLLSGILAIVHFSWSDLSGIIFLFIALYRTLPVVLRRLRESWNSQVVSAG
jgi:hypothetical protein